MLEITTRDDEIKDLKYNTEKHDHENFLKSQKTDNGYYRKNINKSLNKTKVLLNITAISSGSASTITSSYHFLTQA